MDKDFKPYLTEEDYRETLKGVNKIFTEFFGQFTFGQVNNIIQSFSIIQSDKSIFKKSSFGWIYFIEDKDRKLIKIGMTNDVISRFSQFKTNYKFCGLQGKLKIVALCAISKYNSNNLRNVEKFFHNMFAKYHDYMEWYKVDSDILLDILNKYVNKNKYTSKNISETNIFLMNDYNEKLFQCDFSKEVVRKRLDPFYKEKVISIMERHSLEYGHDKLYDVFVNELNEIYIEDNGENYLQKIGKNAENVVKRIENKYLNLDDIFFKQIEKEKNILSKT